MSNPRYDWWPYVKGMIRRYPDLNGNTTRCMKPEPQRRSPACRGAVFPIQPQMPPWELPPIHQKEYEAVRKAVEATRQRKDGTDRLKVIQLVLWDKSHIGWRSHESPMLERTAQEWHRSLSARSAEFWAT